VVTTVSTRKLTKRYGDRVVVDALDLDLSAGEVFGLLGPNGAGKTTTILMLLGLSEPTSGAAEVLGLDPRRRPLEVKRRVGYVPDAVGFYDAMSGSANLRFTARLNRLDPGEIDRRVEAALADVGLTEAADRLAGTYSRGMRQRLGIADALVKDPEVLILDEPTTAIDPEGVSEILALIRRLADERGVTVLLSSHLLNQVQAVCDRVAVFAEGRVAAIGAPHELAARHQGPEVVELAVTPDPTALLHGSAFVMSVDSGRVPGSYRVTAAPGATPRLVRLLGEGDFAVTGVRRAVDDLEDVYRQYFQREVRDV
jgi:ABC-2 type transport system ATP-binding protein